MTQLLSIQHNTKIFQCCQKAPTILPILPPPSPATPLSRQPNRICSLPPTHPHLVLHPPSSQHALQQHQHLIKQSISHLVCIAVPSQPCIHMPPHQHALAQASTRALSHTNTRIHKNIAHTCYYSLGHALTTQHKACNLHRCVGGGERHTVCIAVPGRERKTVQDGGWK